MRWLFELLTAGHTHKWETVKSGTYEDKVRGETIHQGTFYDCKCKICGEYRCFKL